LAKTVHLKFKAKCEPKQSIEQHVFDLQTATRLAHKFEGATHSIGKEMGLERMKVRPMTAATSFRDQKKITYQLTKNPYNNIAPYIHREISIKKGAKEAIEKDNLSRN
jgi:hypothetical protein